MKRFIFPLIALTIGLFSCEEPEEYVHEYEQDPRYSWGYVEFWGPYYEEYGIDNNVLSLSLFTDSLDVNEDNDLNGIGQYLYLEDIFTLPSDTILPAGVYEVSESNEPFSIAPGYLYVEDEVEYDLGAMIYYIERNEAYTVLKYIVDGTMTVSLVNESQTIIDFDFILDDETELKGRYASQLPHFDFSQMYEVNKRREVKLNPVRNFTLQRTAKK